jgi:dienelactone hydrolase
MGLRGRAPAVALVVVIAGAAAGCGGGGDHAAHAPQTTTATAVSSRPLFAYDASRPLEYRDAGRVNGNYPIAIRDVSYAAPSGRVQAYIAVPLTGKNLPAVIFLHGSGEDRRRFVLPAGWVAGRNAVGMTLTLPSSVAGAASPTTTPEERLARDRRIFADDVIAVRRAVDVLAGMPRVDKSRIGLVGWSLGARVGAVAAGVEPRLRSVVLMSGGSLPVAAYVKQAPAALRPQVRASLTEIDPLRWIAKARGSIMLQNGRKDQIVPRPALLALAKAAPKGTVLRWYPTGHDLDARAYRDQLAFLTKTLPISGPPVKGAETGP